MALKLYNFQGSPFGWMARAALAEKGLKYDTVEPRDRETNPELRKLNPLNKTPTLVDDGRAVFESYAVLEYLEEKYPTPPLMPKDPVDRARTRSMAMLAYIYIFPEARTVGMQLFDWAAWDSKTMVYPPRRPADQVDAKIVGPAEERLLGHFRVLDQELASRPWATGDAFGLADIVLAPPTMGYKLRGGPIAEVPNVARWLETCLARPSMRGTATPVVKRGTPV